LLHRIGDGGHAGRKGRADKNGKRDGQNMELLIQIGLVFGSMGLSAAIASATLGGIFRVAGSSRRHPGAS
jgi:hypothetical protein